MPEFRRPAAPGAIGQVLGMWAESGQRRRGLTGLASKTKCADTTSKLSSTSLLRVLTSRRPKRVMSGLRRATGSCVVDSMPSAASRSDTNLPNAVQSCIGLPRGANE